MEIKNLNKDTNRMSILICSNNNRIMNSILKCMNVLGAGVIIVVKLIRPLFYRKGRWKRFYTSLDIKIVIMYVSTVWLRRKM